MGADVSAHMDDSELYCNDCVEHADPFADSGIAIAWPGCSEYVYEVKQRAKQAHETIESLTATRGDVLGTADYATCLMIAAVATVSAYAYGHTVNQHLNSLVSSAAPKWEYNMTEYIALSTS